MICVRWLQRICGGGLEESKLRLTQPILAGTGAELVNYQCFCIVFRMAVCCEFIDFDEEGLTTVGHA